MIIKCGFCGKEYDSDLSDKTGCEGCFFYSPKKECSMSRCPNCGYDNPLPSKWFNKISGFFRKRHRHRFGLHKFEPPGTPVTVTMDRMKTGEVGVVISINTQDNDILNRLMAMTIYPGTLIRIIQDSPSCVFEIGRSKFAVDKELAKNVVLRILE